ncbi:DNA-binding MarR family transcriptional regulator [Cytobacillus horneckiae]|uniref:MarR family transcriptional regulator n=1 Tax=Cytobacillus horneckiae TaxID=549687 RepID=A0A2N0ZLM9_9BACI|nr:MarR family transcriptional regulator [Cytobacillus horneckiae]NRG45884.1 MarR family transcriptional regulator [Bacillus sp. CRN 9]MBN6885844.1 MarR family transcriptional regulator [Cytobacillus horneckiae]MCM3177390.1 MarR family transcriptional regulator [Cytobacillus horneckiae]MEC1156046.1 MarR family transcriptional regulator [Cytobacillus horneckiae]MED2937406.1 MarR family transcriptional regulator [Cytobacillus horneckiae]
MKDQSVFELIHTMEKVTNRLIIQWNQSFNENLGITHILLLGQLKNNGKCRPIDLANYLGIAPSSITHLTDKLLSRKLIIRIADENDKRISYVAITENGLEILQKAQEEGYLLQMRTFEKLSAEERHQLLTIYNKLNNLLEKS